MPDGGATDRSRQTPDAGAPEVPFSSNCIRLTGRQWLVAGLLVAGVAWLVPRFSTPYQLARTDPDFRIPYELSNDYWLYGRAFHRAAATGKTLLVGDSVIWGQYVAKDATLSHYLNRVAGGEDRPFANLGLDGSHPMALEGLVRYYCYDAPPGRIILHFNPLWITSERHDLRTDKEFRFNHPQLVAQFDPNLKCYTASFEERLGIVMTRTLPLFQYANHLRLDHFDGKGLQRWTLEHPYKGPPTSSELARGWPPAVDHARHEPMPWTKRSVDRADFPWVDLDTSYQWSAFKRTVALLQSRRAELFVLVGPFNEHMLKVKSAQRYAEIKRRMAQWLDQQGIPHFVPSVLPSELYADASHPIAEGYAQLAVQFTASPFARFTGRSRGR